MRSDDDGLCASHGQRRVGQRRRGDGHFELNVFKPMISHNNPQGIRLLGDGARSFADNCVVGIEANEQRIQLLMGSSVPYQWFAT